MADTMNHGVLAISDAATAGVAAIAVALITQAGLALVAIVQFRRARSDTEPDNLEAVEVLQEIVERLRAELDLARDQVAVLAHQNGELRASVFQAHAVAGRALERLQYLERELRGRSDNG